MNDNLKLWESVSRVPPEHLKGFKRGGGFAGTAIKPMWSFHKMTEIFGPVGTGWGMSKPDFRVESVGTEILVFCTIAVWAGKPENEVYGVGGDKILAVNKYGPSSDDEGFKKAYTDALTNALKMFGVGADIHMGLWDGNKYADEKPEAEAAASTLPPIHKPSKNVTSRAEYEALNRSLANVVSITALKAWRSDNAIALENLPQDWKDELTVTYQDKASELKKGLAA